MAEKNGLSTAFGDESETNAPAVIFLSGSLEGRAGPTWHLFNTHSGGECV